MQNVSEDVLRIIGSNRAWMKNYGIVLGLTKNPKTPLAMSMNLMARLNSKDLQKLAVDRNVPEALRIAARKKVVAGRFRKSVERGSEPFCLLRLSSSARLPLLLAPLRSHLRQAFHVDRGALALLFARHRFQQIQRLGQVLVNRLRASS